MPIDLAKAMGGGGLVLWVSGDTYAKGDQAIDPTDLGIYVRKVDGAGTTSPNGDDTNWQPLGARAIKSIQRGTFGNVSTTITIADVNPAKTELRMTSNVSEWGSYDGVSYCSIRLTSGTKIAVTYGSTPSGTARGGAWELTEYY